MPALFIVIAFVLAVPVESLKTIAPLEETAGRVTVTAVPVLIKYVNPISAVKAVDLALVKTLSKSPPDLDFSSSLRTFTYCPLKIAAGVVVS